MPCGKRDAPLTLMTCTPVLGSRGPDMTCHLRPQRSKIVRAVDPGDDRLDANIDEVIAPFVEAVRLLKTIPGVGDRTAQTIIAEIGTDMTRFPLGILRRGPDCARGP